MYYSPFFLVLPVLALFSLTTLAIPHNHHVQPRTVQNNNDALAQERADAVKAAFTDAWNGYKKYAFPHDELRPVSNNFSDSRYLHLNAFGYK